MSAPLRPKGPLPARVYWFRRTLVFAVPVLMIVVMARVLGLGESEETARMSLTSEVVGMQAPAPVGPTAPVKPPKRKKDASPTPTTPPPPVLAEPEGVCSDSDVVITPSVPAGITPDGLQIDLTVTTATTPACYWTVTPDSTAVSIRSGADFIWSSRHCGPAVPTQELIVRKDSPVTVPMVWNLRRSDEECSRYTDWVRLGFYHVSTAAIGGEPTEVQFELTRPPAEVVTETVTPSPTPEPKKNKSRNGREFRDGQGGAGTAEPGDG